MRFPHDDEPEDPTANDCNYNFPIRGNLFHLMNILLMGNFAQMLCFVLAVDEIQDFKGCPLPEYFNDPPNPTPR